MLRIEVTWTQSKRVTVTLEGRLVGPWVDEVQRACEPLMQDGRHLTLDFARVSFVDREGVALCRGLKERQATLRNCSLFVKEQIDG